MSVNRRVFIRDFGKYSIALAVVSACGGATGSKLPGVLALDGALDDSRDADNPLSPPAERPAVGLSAPAGPPLLWERAEFRQVSAFVLMRGGEAAVVDTGNAGSIDPIEDALAALDGTWNDVGHVVATHLHNDHIGNFSEVMSLATNATGYAGTLDLPSVRSPRTLVGLEDGDQVFDLDVIGTPGHTPGHICLHDSMNGILIAGDAINGTEGTSIDGPNPAFTPDMFTANQSVARLAALEFETALFGHGEPVLEGADGLVRNLLG